MKAEIKKKWLEALRSGEYKQTKGVLRRGNAYCCLGVLSDIYSKEFGVEWKAHPSDMDVFNIEDDKGIPPMCIQLWAGLTTPNPLVCTDKISNGRETLSSLNDRGVSFEEIADIIEKEF